MSPFGAVLNFNWPGAVVITVLKTIAHKLKSYTFISTEFIEKSPINDLTLTQIGVVGRA